MMTLFLYPLILVHVVADIRKSSLMDAKPPKGARQMQMIGPGAKGKLGVPTMTPSRKPTYRSTTNPTKRPVTLQPTVSPTTGFPVVRITQQPTVSTESTLSPSSRSTALSSTLKPSSFKMNATSAPSIVKITTTAHPTPRVTQKRSSSQPSPRPTIKTRPTAHPTVKTTQKATTHSSTARPSKKPTRKPTRRPSSRPVAPITTKPSTRPTQYPISKPVNNNPTPIGSLTVKPTGISTTSKALSTIRIELYITASTLRNLATSSDPQLILILQTILNFVYKVQFPLYHSVIIAAEPLSQVMSNNNLVLSYKLDCRLQFTTTDMLVLPPVRDLNLITLGALSDPAYVPLYQSSSDPMLLHVFRTNATLFFDEANTAGGTTTSSTSSTDTKGNNQSISPVSSWTITVIASAVASSAIIVLVIIFAMRRRAMQQQQQQQRSRQQDDYLSNSTSMIQDHLPHPNLNLDLKSVGGSSQNTDDAQIWVRASDTTLGDQSTEYSLNSNMYKSEYGGYDSMSLVSGMSESKHGIAMDTLSLDESKNGYSNSSSIIQSRDNMSFSKVWNSDVEESNHSVDSPVKSMEDSEDGNSLSYLHVYYGKHPSFTLELLGGFDRHKTTDDFSQSEVDVVSTDDNSMYSSYVNE